MINKKRNTSKKTYSIIAGIFTLILFSLLAISSIFLQKKLRENQDIRKEAWTENGNVVLSTSPEAGEIFTVGEEINIQVLINTNNIAIDGIQLQGIVNASSSEIFGNGVNVEHQLDNTNLQTVIFEPTHNVGDIAHNLQLLAISNNPTMPYISNGDEYLYTYQFTPTTAGEFTVTFGLESFAINSNGHEIDELSLVGGELPSFTFYVVEEGVTPSPTPTTDPLLSPTPTPTLGACVEAGIWCNSSLGPNDPCLGLSCCEGLDSLMPEQKYNMSDCSLNDMTGFSTVCSDCGNSICEEWENKCSCPEDCDSNITPTPTQSPVVDSCPAPTNFIINTESISCHNEDTFSATLSWDAVEGAEQYWLIGYNIENPANFIDFTFPASQTSYTLTQQAEGTWYFYLWVFSSDEEICIADLDNYSEAHYTFECQDDEPLYCNYDSCSYGACINGYRSVTCAASDDSSPECADTITHNEPCMAQCNYSCGAWSICGIDHLQTRTCAATNTPCWDYSGNNRGTSYTETQYCNLNDDEITDILFASYEACWYNSSDGISTYIAWNASNYHNVQWVDISPYSDFSRLSHKNVEGADISNGYGITNGQNFFWSDNNDRFYFEPETTYYARLYYYDGSNYHHSRTVTFRMARCGGIGGVSYRQCNETCNSNSECATGLACLSGRCRLPSNPNSEICIDPYALRGCAQWCADSRECQDNLTCWYNYCRNPKNIDITITSEQSIALELERARQTNCADWNPDPKAYYYVYYSPANQSTQTKGGLETSDSAPISTTIKIEGCDQYCSSNAQCKMNMRCYKNSCRLALNPESKICDLNDKASIKGSDDSSNSLKTTIKPSRNPEKVYIEDDVKTSFIEKNSTTEDEITKNENEIDSQTALDTIREYLDEKGISLQTLAILAGGLFLILIILIILAAKNQNKPDNTNVTMPPSTLKGINQPPMPQQTNSTNPPPPTLKQTIPPATPPSMTQRLREKGINPTNFNR